MDRGEWRAVAPSERVAPGAVLAIEVGGRDWVAWRTETGRLGVVDRRCPHLDEDLADARVHGEELECRAHGWCVTVDGATLKRNLRGREDAKGSTATLPVRERGGSIEVESGGGATR